jgi:hypothetical protein
MKNNRKLCELPLLSFFALPLLLTGCFGILDGVKPVNDFEVNRYLGTWHEIARLDHSFERGLSNVTAQYSMREDGCFREHPKSAKRSWASLSSRLNRWESTGSFLPQQHFMIFRRPEQQQ